MLGRIVFSFFALASVLAAQNGGGAAGAKPAVLACPPAGQPFAEDPATFTWSAGTGTPNYRLLLGAMPGNGSVGDTSLISGLKGELSGLPAGQKLYVTLWSYDAAGNAVQPPSVCAIQTAPNQRAIGFQNQPGTLFTGVSLGSFSAAGSDSPSPLSVEALAAASQACQARCKENAGCQGFTYYPMGNGNPTAMCDLKSQIAKTEANDCCLSALKTVKYETAPAPAPPPPAPEITSSAGKKGKRQPKESSRKEPNREKEAKLESAPPKPSPSKPAPAKESASPENSAKGISGDWVNQLGGVTRITQQGNSVKGTYTDAKQPDLQGTLQGTFDGQILRATLEWKNAGDASRGTLLLTLTAQGKLEGTWTDAMGISGPWNMSPSPRVAH